MRVQLPTAQFTVYITRGPIEQRLAIGGTEQVQAAMSNFQKQVLFCHDCDTLGECLMEAGSVHDKNHLHESGEPIFITIYHNWSSISEPMISMDCS